MPEKDPLNYSLVTYAWVVMWSVWGGMVSFYNKLKAGHVRAFNITELLGELCTSGFVGVITFWLCEQAEIQPLMSAALIGISGHMGSRALFMLEKFLSKKIGVDHEIPR